MRFFVFSVILSVFIRCSQAGDDASVHVHVESAPGPDMGMTLPLFNYYRSAVGQQSNPALLAAFQKWHGDEFHNHGPDPPVSPTPTPVPAFDSAELAPSRPWRPLEIAPADPYAEPRRLGPHTPRRPGSAGRLLSPKKPAGQVSREYVIPFPQLRKKQNGQPRHYHGQGERYTDRVPDWIMRKKFVKKYGLRKYLEPYTQSEFERGLERNEYYDPHSAPLAVAPGQDLYIPTAGYDYEIDT